MKFTRMYPVYKYQIKSDGRHKQDQNFFFL